ncbi:hypothetical protein C0L77_000597 [Clostridium perfringens]|uniref:hypothetical protein n=1 Tax=Clostridium perfringens TaxID=1502 RepID=UPI00016BD1E5|nr:hypothetical protein [Clostridium perfringens]EDT26076.1 hypothetical protein AC5_0838 [Clostridium perfringens CPE str. F4969]STB59715.1 Uncharacterised protein [Clostridium perfringens]
MSNLEMGLNNNITLLENTLTKKNASKQNLLNIYGNLKVLEYRAFSEKESDLLYRIQTVLMDLEEYIID